MVFYFNNEKWQVLYRLYNKYEEYCYYLYNDFKILINAIFINGNLLLYICVIL